MPIGARTLTLRVKCIVSGVGVAIIVNRKPLKSPFFAGIGGKRFYTWFPWIFDAFEAGSVCFWWEWRACVILAPRKIKICQNSFILCSLWKIWQVYSRYTPQRFLSKQREKSVKKSPFSWLLRYTLKTEFESLKLLKQRVLLSIVIDCITHLAITL